jgi:hypothetical protein
MEIVDPHHSALRRLALALLLGTALGTLDWWAEIERIDKKWSN